MVCGERRYVGSGGHAVEHQTVNQGDGGSISPAAVGGPFCLVSMPGEVKDPTMTIMVSKLTGGH